ncbi:MAG: ABC transporter substrate-binding protein [Chloroflexota bacterium]
MKRVIGWILLAVMVLTACAPASPAATPESLASGGQTAPTAPENTPAPVEQSTPTSTATPTPTRLVIRTSTDPDNLDPHLSAASLTQQIMLNVFEGLVKPAPDSSVLPGLAESYTVSEDGMTYTFKLRAGAKFHDGSPVTVDDVRYSFERLMGKGMEKPLTSNLNDVESIETPDDRTVVFKLKQTNSSFLALLPTLAVLPAANDGKHGETPIGTGPYKFVEYTPQQRIVLEKFTEYWQEGVPSIDRVEFVIIPDDQTAFLQLQSGAIDFTGISADQIQQLDAKFKVITQGANSVMLMGMNQAIEPFNNPDVRRAIYHAIDRTAINAAVYDGLATILGSNMSPVMQKYYEPGLEKMYPPDVEKAKELLAKAGYPNGFQMTLSISSHAAVYAQIAQIIAEQLKKVGIDVQIETVEWGVWLERIYTNREYQTTIIDFTGKLDPYAVLGRYKSDFRRNFFNYNNAAYDELMVQALRETDEAKRIELYKQAQRILAEDAAAIYLLDYPFHWAMKASVQGYTPYPIFFHDLSLLSIAP